MLIAAGVAFPERDLLIFIAAGVILLSLIVACVCLPLLLRGLVSEPDLRLKREVRDAWKRTTPAAIKALESEELPGSTQSTDAAVAVMATEVKSRIMSEYRHRLEIFDDTAEAQALAFQMDQLEKRMRLNALRAQRLELYSLHRHRQIGDDVLRVILAELDLNEANLGVVKQERG
jgi:CPA1 family monovalent cation:H+ antiporter